MKVALVAEWLDAWRGGAETSTIQFMRHLMAAGAEVHVFTRSRPSPTPGLEVYTLSGAAMSRTRRSATFAHRVGRLLQPGRFDVVHAISPCPVADIYQPRGGTLRETIERNIALRGAASARFFKRHANRFNLKQRYLLTLERKLLGGADGPIVIAISDYVLRQLKEHYALPDERIRLIYNGVDGDDASEGQRRENRATIRREFAIRDDQCLVITIAHNFRLKGVNRWMEAMALLLRRGVRDVRALVIGKGESPAWHRLAGRLGIADYLTFTGPSERVSAFRHAADVLVHPTYYDPCSRVVLEGMVSGLPCVTTRWDGASEMIEDGANGFVLADPDDVDELAQAVDRLRDVNLRHAVGEAARSMRSRVDMAEHTRRVLSLYESLATAGARR